MRIAARRQCAAHLRCKTTRGGKDEDAPPEAAPSKDAPVPAGKPMVSAVALVVAFYCACSGGMLVLNKLAVHYIGAPAFVTVAQFVATTLGVGAGWLAGWIELDPLEWRKVKHFIVYILAFSGGTWANMKVLMTANVETVIVFRSCAPLCVSVLDYYFYNRAMPSRRCWSTAAGEGAWRSTSAPTSAG